MFPLAQSSMWAPTSLSLQSWGTRLHASWSASSLPPTATPGSPPDWPDLGSSHPPDAPVRLLWLCSPPWLGYFMQDRTLLHLTQHSPQPFWKPLSSYSSCLRDLDSPLASLSSPVWIAAPVFTTGLRADLLCRCLCRGWWRKPESLKNKYKARRGGTSVEFQSFPSIPLRQEDHQVEASPGFKATRCNHIYLKSHT